MPYRVVLSDQKTVDVETGREVFAEASENGTEVELDVVSDPPRTPEAVLDMLGDAEGLIVDAATPVSKEVLEGAENLEVVGRAGIGVDNVDVAAASEEGVVVVNVPDYAIEEVSTHALALLLACVRKVGVYDAQVKTGTWNWEDGRPLHRLRGKTVGLLAYGKIARRFAAKIAGFDLNLVACDPYVAGEEMAAADVEKVGFEELLDRSDLLSVHAPLTDETKHLLDADAFDRLGGSGSGENESGGRSENGDGTGTENEGVVVINTARGPVINVDALEGALSQDTIAAAGLDVFDPEPPGDHPLCDRDDVLLTPHTAWYSEESRRELSRSVAADVLRVLRGEDPDSPVDPESGWF